MKSTCLLLFAIVALLNATAALAQGDWRAVQGPDGVFVVEMPGEPTRQTKTNGISGGPSYVHHSYVLAHGSERFAIHTYPLPAHVVSQPRIRLQDLLDEVAASSLAGRKWQKVDWLDMAMATAVAVSGTGVDGKILRGFFALKGSRIIALLFAGPPGSEAGPNAERFFSSFRMH